MKGNKSACGKQAPQNHEQVDPANQANQGADDPPLHLLRAKRQQAIAHNQAQAQDEVKNDDGEVVDSHFLVHRKNPPDNG